MHRAFFVSTSLLAATTFAGDTKPATKQTWKSEDAKTSYALGVDIGNNLKNIPIAMDFEQLQKGIKDSFAGQPAALSEQEMGQIKMAISKKMQEVRAKTAQAAGDKNKKDGDAFLEKNKKEKGVVTTKSGLQYSVIKEGTGAKPKATDKVKVHYRGTLIDGKEFDSSIARGEPAEFPVNGVIAGWTEALQLMKVGSKYRLVIPSSLAYGERGAGPDIGPGAVLVFEVELLAITK